MTLILTEVRRIVQQLLIKGPGILEHRVHVQFSSSKEGSHFHLPLIYKIQLLTSHQIFMTLN